MDAGECLTRALRAGTSRMTMELDVPMLDRRQEDLFDARAVASFTLNVAQCMAACVGGDDRTVKVIFPDEASATAAQAQWARAFQVTTGKYQHMLEAASLGVSGGDGGVASMDDLPAVQAQTERVVAAQDAAFVLVCPASMAELMALRTLLDAAGDRPVLVLNPKFSIQPVELFRSECVFAIKPFRLLGRSQQSSTTPGYVAPRVNRNAPGAGSEAKAPSGFNPKLISAKRRKEFEERYGISMEEMEEDEEEAAVPTPTPEVEEAGQASTDASGESDPRPSVVLMKRFGRDWELFVDADDGRGYMFVASHPTRPEPGQLIQEAAAFMQTAASSGDAGPSSLSPPVAADEGAYNQGEAIAYLNGVFAASLDQPGPDGPMMRSSDAPVGLGEDEEAPYALLDRLFVDDLNRMLGDSPSADDDRSPDDPSSDPTSDLNRIFNLSPDEQ